MHYARTPQTQVLLWGLTGLLCLSAYAQQPAAGGKETKAPVDEKTIEARKAKAKAAQPAAAQREGYKIGSGDVLDILVWKEPDASIAGMVVRADGKVTLPFLKDIQVAGFTPSDLEQKIKLDLSKYIQDAEVTVLVKNVVSEKVYVLGAVRKAGPLVMTGPITALQAIAEAGGPTDYAKKKKTYVLRGGQKIPFNYDAIIKGQNMEQNITLLPGDTIVVP
jgi:polysaccharide export outer membrane protein